MSCTVLNRAEFPPADVDLLLGLDGRNKVGDWRVQNFTGDNVHQGTGFCRQQASVLRK